MRAAILVLLLGGCNIVFGFDDIHPTPDAPPPPPNVFSSPGPRRHSMGYDFAKAVSVTIAADDPTTMIFHTTDGTMPTEASPHAMTPTPAISISATETLEYFGSADGAASTATSEKYYVATAAQSVAGYHVTGILLDGMSPVVTVHPGQILTMATAKAQVWVQGVCPMCAAQIVYGVDDDDQGCLFDSGRDDPTGPGIYPGFTRNATFRVTAPTTPGIHEVRVTHAEQTSCAMAMAMHSLQTRPDLSRIGVLIVQ